MSITNLANIAKIKAELEQIVYSFCGEPNNIHIRTKMADDLWRAMMRRGADKELDGYECAVHPYGQVCIKLFIGDNKYDFNMGLSQVLSTGPDCSAVSKTALPPAAPIILNTIVSKHLDDLLDKVQSAENSSFGVKEAPKDEEDPVAAFERAMGMFGKV